MKQNIQVFPESSSLWDKFFNLNPQLFREIKGKFKTRNVVIAAAVSVIAQFFTVICFLAELPQPDPDKLLKVQYGRYALGNGTSSSAYAQDMLGNWIINWQLLWLDIFITLSVISIFALIVIGTYMLVADTVKEEERGTLNFIRLSPQSATTVLLGKILGVPILLYAAILLLFPLHLVSGLGAHIPLVMILGFYGVTIASCAFCYSLAILWSLASTSFSGLKPWLASGAIGFILFILTAATFNNDRLITNATWDWLLLFNPLLVLSYLIENTSLPLNKIDFVPADNLAELLFYGQALWTEASVGIAFILLNFTVWTYWCWSVLKRRFHNPTNTLISKTQSYWLTGWFVIFSLGFTLQDNNSYSAEDNFIFLQMCLCMLGLVLIAALSPHRQALYDWSRYRHQTNKDGNILWKELIFGENSPSGIAILINMAIALIYITPSIFLILNTSDRHIFWGFLLSGLTIVIYGLVAQMFLTLKTRKRSIWSAVSVTSLIIVLPLCLGFADIDPNDRALPWLFSFLPTVATEYATLSTVMLAILGQTIIISALGFQMTNQLKQAGKSETKMLGNPQ